MLLRVILLLLLAVVVLQATTIVNQDSLIGLKRIINRVDSSDTTNNGCKTLKCVNRSNFYINKSLLYERLARPVENIIEEGNTEISIEEGRGKKGKKKKGYGKIFMVLGGITKAAILYIMIQAVAVLATKALVIAKVALLIATALALRKSVDNKTSFEIVKHPHYSSKQTHSSSVDYDHSGGNDGYDIGSRSKRRAYY